MRRSAVCSSMPRFNDLLAEANAEAKADWSPLRPKECKSNDEAKDDSKRNCGETKSSRLDPDKAAELVNLVSEYLFDLFDANMMEEFHVLEDFEIRHMEFFDPDSEEFTFKQEELHTEFVKLMEGYVEKYIEKEGYTLEQFYEAVHAQHDETSQGGDDARECMEVLFEMADIRVWVEGMKARVRFRLLHDKKFTLRR